MWLKADALNATYTSKFVAQSTFLLDAVEAKKLHLGMQQVTDFNLEVLRLKRVYQVSQLQSHQITSHSVRLQITAFDQFVTTASIRRYSLEQDTRAESMYQHIQTEIRSLVPGMGITQLELHELRQAIPSIAATKWYKCSKGHFYAVGDCGQLNQSGMCPECKERVGGGSGNMPTNLPF